MRPQLVASVVVLAMIAVAGLAGCGNTTPFSYQVSVEDARSRAPISNARVSIVATGIAPVTAVTDSNGFALLFINEDIAGKLGRLRVEASGYGAKDLVINLNPTELPNIVSLEQPVISEAPAPPTLTPLPPPTLTPLPVPTIPPTTPPLPSPPPVNVAGPVALTLDSAAPDPLVTTVCVAPGATITVSADGIVTVGPNIGQVTPDGKDRSRGRGLFSYLQELQSDPRLSPRYVAVPGWRQE